MRFSNAQSLSANIASLSLISDAKRDLTRFPVAFSFPYRFFSRLFSLGSSLFMYARSVALNAGRYTRKAVKGCFVEYKLQIKRNMH